MSDEELLAAVRAGDTDSLGTLVLRWQEPLFRFVYRMLPRTEDARDICQETFLRVLKKAHRFQEGSRFSTWMYQIALNLCRDKLRKRKRWKLVMVRDREFDERVATPDPAACADDPARVVQSREESAAVLRALRQLPDEQREVLVLKEFEGLKFREIAELLGCPESTVKSRMYYGLNGMRTALSRQGVRR